MHDSQGLPPPRALHSIPPHPRGHPSMPSVSKKGATKMFVITTVAVVASLVVVLVVSSSWAVVAEYYS